MQRLRVLHVCHDLVGGGAEKQLRLLLQESAANGMDAAVLCVRTAGLAEADLGCRIFRFDRRGKLDLRIFGYARRVVREFAPDIVHLWLPPVVTIPALLAATFARIRCVYSYRSAMRFETSLHVPEYLLLLACAHKIVSNNPPQQSRWHYRWAYRLKRGEQIDNAIVRRAPEPAAAPRAAGERPAILFAGRLSPVKNLRLLLDAFAQLRRTMECELLICGTGEQKDEIAAHIARLRLGADVRLLGFRDDIPELMRRSDLFVLPSLYEGAPNAAIEACEARLPLVLSDIPPHRPFVDAGAALSFDPQDAGALAAALARVLSDSSLRTAMSQRAEGLLAGRDPARMAAKYRAAYLDTLGDTLGDTLAG